jgi:hypothetical protein
MAHYEDRFCWQRPWSDFVREVGSGGGGVTCVEPESNKFQPQATGRLFTSCQDFLLPTCKKSRILVE